MAVDVVAWVLVAFAHIYCTHGNQFHKPIALGVLKQDLRILAEQFPSADGWPLSKVIKYDDNIQFEVDYAEQSANEDGPHTLAVVVGKLSMATYRTSAGGQELVSLKLVHKLFVDKNNVYFDDLKQPQTNLEGYYIIGYHPEYTQRKTDYKPVIEYMAEKQFWSELREHIPRIRYESSLSKAEIIKTYIRMKNGQKIQVRYQHSFEVAVLEADFYCLVNNDNPDIIEKTVHFKELSYDFKKLLAPDLPTIGYTYAMRVVSFPSSSVNNPTGSFKVTRDVLLKDLWDSASMYTTRTSDVIGVIKYDNDKIVTLSYTSTDQNSPLALNGRFLTSDGISFSWLCIASPQNQSDEESLSQLKGSNSFSGKRVFFSCPENGKDSLILFQEDADFIEIVSGDSKTNDVIKKLSSVEPYIEYISFDQFHRTLEILTNIMTVRCAEGHPRKSYRLFGNVLVNYDCNTTIASFEALNLWFRPGPYVSFSIEEIRGISYDSKSKHFKHEGNVISGFKLRQLYPVFQNKIPTALRFISYSGTNDIAFDLKSIELDLNNIRRNLLRNILPVWGVIFIDNSVLLIAEKSKRTIDGVKKSTIVVKCKVPQPDSCNQRECMGENLVIYDGSKIVVRDGQLDVHPLPAKVYWPERQTLPALNNAFSVGYRVHYVKLTTFKNDMKKLSDYLRGHCVTIQRNGPTTKLTLRIYYPQNRAPMVGYYECELNYIFFTSSFKIIKLSTLHVKENSGGNELQTKVSSNNIRKKDLQSKYVLRDLQYDPIGDVLHSKSMFLTEVYALRLLTTSMEDSFQKGRLVKIQLRDGLNVEVN